MIGEPANPPSLSMIKALRDLLPLHPEVKEAYLFMKGTPVDKPILTLGIRFVEDNREFHNAIQSIARVIEAYITKNDLIDIMPLTEGNIYQTVKNVDNALIYEAI